MTAPAWTPPDHPDPFEILHSAVADRRAGNYERALAKHLWFHRYGKQIQPSISAVRLSFALGYWLKLAKVYPPARAAFLKTRDETEAAFQQHDNFDLFDDLASLNRELDDSARTAVVFLSVAEQDPDAVRRLYHVAERYLVAAGCYAACNPFLDPARRLAAAEQRYELNRSFEASRPAGPIAPPPIARRLYLDDVGTLIALLVLNHRPDEAEHAYEAALSVVNDDESKSVLVAALAGHPPERG